MSNPHPMRRLALAAITGLFVLAAWVTNARAQGLPPGQLELGARLFAENCVVCHGQDGQGRIGATLAKDWPSIRPDLRIQETIENGVQGSVMPAWSQKNGGPLDDTEIAALVAYILTWETGGPRQIPATPTPRPRPALTAIPEVAGDPNQGGVVFDQNCQVCHGQNGEGRIGATLAKAWPAIRSDLRIKTTISNGIEGSLMPAWSQTNGGPLSDAEIDNLVAYILSLPDIAQSEAPAPTPQPLNPWLTGWGGVLLTTLLFILLIVVAIWVQTRRSAE